MVVQERNKNQDLITHQIVTSRLDTLADGSHTVPLRENQREGACITASPHWAVYTPVLHSDSAVNHVFDPFSKLQKQQIQDTPTSHKAIQRAKGNDPATEALGPHYNCLLNSSRVSPQAPP